MSKLTDFVAAKTMKAFIKTKKGKALLITLVTGCLGYTLPPEALDALITLLSVMGI